MLSKVSAELILFWRKGDYIMIRYKSKKELLKDSIEGASIELQLMWLYELTLLQMQDDRCLDELTVIPCHKVELDNVICTLGKYSSEFIQSGIFGARKTFDVLISLRSDLNTLAGQFGITLDWGNMLPL